MNAQVTGRAARSPDPRGRTPGGGTNSPGLDYLLVAILALLLALGLVTVLSASFAVKSPGLFVKQLVAVVVGIIAFLVMVRVPYHFWQRLAIPIMILALALLIAVLIFGESVLGSRRTFMGIQPSEFSKLAVIIYMSAWVTAKGEQLTRLQDGPIPFVILMGAVTALLALEPSFSVAIIILIIGLTIFFVGGADIRHLLLLGVTGTGVLILVLSQHSYVMKRILTWWHGQGAPVDVLKAWQGGLFGDGSILARITQGSPIPLPHNDYLFAYTGYLLGIVGALIIVALFAALGYRCLGIALNAPDKFGTLVAVGITTWIMVQAAIHMTTSLSLTPHTGQPLPFMSAGGSAMVSCMIAMGLMMNIWRASPEKRALHANLAIGRRDRGTRVSHSGGRQPAERESSQPQVNRPAKRRPRFAIQIPRRTKVTTARTEGRRKPKDNRRTPPKRPTSASRQSPTDVRR